MMKICFATNNKNKLKEIRFALEDSFEVLSLEDIGCYEELPENQETLEGNSKEKAQFVYDKYQIACFADDTGLEVDALDGRPGVYSARYAGPACDSEQNMQKLLEEMNTSTNRTAKFRTVITLITPEITQFFEGSAEGEITKQKSGSGGFGYDPIFSPKGYDRTFSEMTMEEKNAISHRGLAVKKLISFLKDYKV